MKGSKIISDAIISNDLKVVIVGGKSYVIKPSTINGIAGAGAYLPPFENINSIGEIFNTFKDAKDISHALSYLIQGDDSLFNELAKGTYDENVDALSEALSMIDTGNFTRLSALARNVASLIAKQ